MATSKAKRTVPLAQLQRRSPNSEPAELLPVKAHVYQAIAELNGGFEKVVRDLQTVGRISFLPSDRITAMHDLICRVRAQANRDLTPSTTARWRMPAILAAYALNGKKKLEITPPMARQLFVSL
jgi:hypothetical protein